MRGVRIAIVASLLVGSAAPARADGTHAADFLAFWKEVQANCRLLGIKKIPWANIRRAYLPRIQRARDDVAFLQLMTEVVGKLKDGHAYLSPSRVKLQVVAPGPKNGRPVSVSLTRDQSLAYERIYAAPPGLQRAGDMRFTLLSGSGVGYLHLRRRWPGWASDTG